MKNFEISLEKMLNFLDIEINKNIYFFLCVTYNINYNI